MSIALIPIVLTLFIWHQDNPFPYPLNWDIYEHQTLINQILKGNFSLIPSHLTDTFTVDGYTTLFHSILALLQFVFKVQPLQFWWIVELLFFVLTVLVSVWLAWEVFENHWIAFFSGVLASFIFESYIAYTSLFLLPQTVAGLLTIIAFVRVFRFYKSQEPLIDLGQLLLLLAIFLTHFMVGSVGVALLLLTTFLLQFQEKQIKGHFITSWFLMASFFVFLLSILLNFFFQFNFLGTPESVYFNLNLAQKREIMKDWYGYSPLILLPLGIFTFWRESREGEEDKDVRGIILVILFLILALVVAPLPYSVKFYVVARYFVHLVMAVGIVKLIFLLPSKILRTIMSVFFFLMIALIFFANQANYKSILYYHGIATHVTQNEMSAADFLKKNYANQADVLLVSDPATQYILEALSGINSQGGAYMSLDTRHKLNEFYQNQTPDPKLLFEIKDYLEPIPSQKILLILSGRYFAWQKSLMDAKLAIYFNIWQPKDLSYEDLIYIRKLERLDQFVKIFEDEGMVIFEGQRT